MSTTSPLILNQLGEAVGRAVAALPHRPTVLDLPPGPSPWFARPGDDGSILHDAEILLSGPHPSWGDAPFDPPASWPGRLRWVHSSATGVDWAPGWMRAGAPALTCGRGHNATQVAEYVLAAILGREKPLERIAVRDRAAWLAGTGFAAANSTRGLSGRTLALAGFGSIGRAVADRARAFGMQVCVWRRRPWAAGEAERDGVTPLPSLRALAAAAEHLVLALPLTDATRLCVDADVLSAARPGLHLVNVSRGGILDQAALLSALDNGRVGFATLDVTEPEPLPDGHPFWTHAGIRLTPHLAWTGTADRTQLVQQIGANLDAFLAGDPLGDVVDPAQGY